MPTDPVLDPTSDERNRSVVHLLLSRVARSPDGEAFRYPSDGPHPGDERWASADWREVSARALRQSAGLIALGIGVGDRVAIASATRYEWILADLAVMCAGAATTAIYPTTKPAEVAYILAHSGSSVVFAEDEAQVTTLRGLRADLPQLQRVVVISGTGDGDWVVGLDDLEDLGRDRLAADPRAVSARISQIRPDTLATLIYTAGTTGRPKGVRLPHSAWTYEAAAIDATGILTPDDLQFLWLPLAHVFGKALVTVAVRIGFPTAVDGRADRIFENLATVRPTFMGAVPRIFEKANAQILAAVRRENRVRSALRGWACGIGLRASRVRHGGTTPNAMLALEYRLADRLVLRKIRALFGGRLRFFISGSCRLNRELAQRFDGLGLAILEGYGLSETGGPAFVNRPDAYRLGSVGRSLPGTEARIADDGEVLIRGPGVMTGYHRDRAETARALSPEGWFHTGDIGSIDDDGYLHLLDRKKDVFKTSNGKYVPPSAIAARFEEICPYVGELLVIGELRPYCVALVGLDEESIREWGREHGFGNAPFADIARSDAAHHLIDGYIRQLNAQLNRWESIKRFAILDRPLTEQDGDLTADGRIRRREVLTKFAGQVDSLYGS